MLYRPWVWVLQQVAVFGAGIVMWAPITDRFVDPPAWFRTGWKVVYMIGVWFAGVGIANVYWFSGTAFYESHEAGAAAFGFSALQDQANAGTVMILAHCAITFGAIAVLFFRHASERGLEQRLIEAGVPEDTVHRATFDGHLPELAAQAGVPVVPVALRGVRSVLRDGTWYARRGAIAVTVCAPIVPDGDDWAATLRLRDRARVEILKYCGEPDLAPAAARGDATS